VKDLASQLQEALGASYTIERELGGGGMSRVFLATEIALGRRVVIKVLPPELAAGLSVDRFRREIQLAASLQHPHIVPVLAAGSAGGLLYYTMPMVEGESLRARLTHQGELPVGPAIRILRDVADALACAHERGVIHRDIKPDNVLLSRHHGLVTDFGVANALSDATGPSSITSTGLALGTPAYMAPEQATADPHVDHRADIYALGAVGYEILAGRPPFLGTSPQAVLAAHVTQAPDPLDKVRSSVPPALASLIMRCLEKRASDRWQSAEEILHQLEAMATPSGGTAPTTPARAVGRAGVMAEDLRRHPVRALVLFLVAATLVLGLTRFLVLRLGLPDWVLPAAVVLLAVGLPIIMATALIHWRGDSHRWFTWPKAISGGVAAFAGLGVLTSGYMVMRAFGIGPAGSLVASGVLKDRERIIVADFENRTGDPLLGEALSQAFRVDFAQSPVVTAVQPEFVRDVLSRMGKPDSARLEAPLAREVAIREGIKAVVAGDISPAGRQFVLSARLIEAEDGGVLAAYRETAKDSGEVIRAVDRLSKRLRERIGESLRSIRGSPPLDRVTTRSLEALRKYSQGVQVADQGNLPRGVTLLEEAIALDSGFAMAHRKVGILLGNMGQRRSREIQALSKAFEYRDRLTDRERYLAAGSYYAAVTGERDKARDAYLTLLDLYPNDDIALNNLAQEYEWNRDYTSASRLYWRAAAIDSSGPVYYTNLGAALFAQGLPDSAMNVLGLAERKFPGHPHPLMYRGILFAARGAYDSAALHIRRLAEGREAERGLRSLAYVQLANIAAVQGRLAEAQRRLEQAMAIDEERGEVPGYMRSAANRSILATWAAGRPDEAIGGLEAELRRHPLGSITPTERPYLEIVDAYAVARRSAKAKALLEEHERTIPLSVRRNDEPLRHRSRGLLALAEGHPHDAVTEFRAADQGACQLCALPGLARAYDLAGQPDSALAVYERYVTTRAPFRVMADGTWLPATYYRLGELYEARGERAKAADYYGRFIDLWKGADQALQPRVVEAKRRLASLMAEPQK
jgi:eukaryotic-like serine/threonine-protein kinase